MSTEKREYHIAMDSLTAITLMSALDVIVSGIEDGARSDMLTNVNEQVDRDHTRFLNDPINLESNMDTPTTEKKPIDIAVEGIQRERRITVFANQIIAEAKSSGVDESDIVHEILTEMSQIIRDKMDKKLNQE